MNLPFGGETVTLIKRTETADAVTGRKTAVYTSVKLYGCSWRHRTRNTTMYTVSNVSPVGIEDEITCRVPEGQTRPDVNDVMVYGEYNGTISSGADIDALVNARRSTGGACVVKSVSDNTFGFAPFPHYKAVGN